MAQAWGCKECFNIEVKTAQNEISPGIWECPECSYPNTEYDFWELEVEGKFHHVEGKSPDLLILDEGQYFD